MPNLLGQTAGGYLVEDDSGNVFNLPDPPNIASMSGVQAPAPEPLPSAFVPMPQEQAAPLVGAEPAPQIVPVTKAEAAPAPQQQQPKAQDPTFQSAFNDQASALAMQGEAGAQRAAVDTEAAQQQAQLIEQRNADIQKAQAADQQKIAEAQQRHAKAMADTDAAVNEYNSTKVDAGKLWKDKSTASKWGLALSLIASGWASANTGKMGENPALSIWLNAVDRDIKLQQQAKADKLNTIGLAKDKASSFERLTQDTIAQASLHKAAILEDNAREVEALAAKMKPGQIQADYMNFAAGLRAERGKFAMAAADQIAQDRNQKAQIAASNYSTSVTRKNHLDSLKFNREQFEFNKQQAARDAAAAGDQAMAKEIADKGVPDLKSSDGKMYLARDSKAASEVATHFSSTKNIKDIIGRMRTLKREAGAELTGKKAALMDHLGAMLGTELRVAQKMGTLDNGAIAQLNTEMGIAPGSSFSEGNFKTWITRKAGIGDENALAVLDSLSDLQVKSFNTFAESMRSPLGGDYKPYIFEEADAPKEKTDLEILGADLGKGSEGGPGWVDEGGNPLSPQMAKLAPNGASKLPTSYENYTKIKSLFDQANAGTGNSPAALAKLASLADNGALTEDVQRTASIALSAIGKVKDLDQVWRNEMLSEARGVDYRSPEAARLFDQAKAIAKQGQKK